MSEYASALSTLDLDESALRQIIDRLTDEAPNIADVILSMSLFTISTAPDRLGDVPAQTVEIRRSHLTALVALLDETLAHVAAIFDAIDLEGRISDADMLTPVRDGIETAGRALGDIVNALHRPYQY